LSITLTIEASQQARHGSWKGVISQTFTGGYQMAFAGGGYSILAKGARAQAMPELMLPLDGWGLVLPLSELLQLPSMPFVCLVE